MSFTTYSCKNQNMCISEKEQVRNVKRIEKFKSNTPDSDALYDISAKKAMLLQKS